jgi:hypothetical protein
MVVAATQPGATNSTQLAAYIQAGIDPAQAQQVAGRREFLARVLQQIGDSGKTIRTPAALGLNLLADAIAQHGYQSATADQATMQHKLAAAIYPNDPRAQRLYLSDPEGMSKAEIARYYTPIDVRQGNTVLNAPAQGAPQYTAPVLHDDNGVYSAQTPTQVSVTPVATPQLNQPGAPPQMSLQRPPNYVEQTGQQNADTNAIHAAVAQAAQTEAARHNVADEGIQQQKIPIELGMMRAALTGAGASAQNANTTQSNSPMVAPPPGYVLDH